MTYINHIEKDTLSSIVKGTATWRKDPGRETEGYYIYLPKLQEYHPIHYIEEDCLWVYITVNERNKWYTIKPVPRKHGLGPQLQPVAGIDVDDDKDTDTTTISTTTTPPATIINPTAPTYAGIFTPAPTQTTNMSLVGTSTTTAPTMTSSTLPSRSGTTNPPTGGGGRGGGGGGGGGGGVPAPPGGGGRGGGGGGGGGGAAGGPPHANGRLEENPPFEFTGDRERSKAFMLTFQIYRGMNPNTDVMTNPYQQSMTFLSYIRGALVDDWVQEQAQWLVNQITAGVLQTKENLWQTVNIRFRQAYTNTAESSKAQHELKMLHMVKDNLDDFISQFQNLANKAGYNLDQQVTLDLFQNGLPNNLVWNCVKFDHPYNWATWTNSAHQQHEEYIQLSNWLKGNKVMGGTQEQWTNALTCH